MGKKSRNGWNKYTSKMSQVQQGQRPWEKSQNTNSHLTDSNHVSSNGPKNMGQSQKRGGVEPSGSNLERASSSSWEERIYALQQENNVTNYQPVPAPTPKVNPWNRNQESRPPQSQSKPPKREASLPDKNSPMLRRTSEKSSDENMTTAKTSKKKRRMRGNTVLVVGLHPAKSEVSVPQTKVQPLKIKEGPKPRAQLPLAATESSPKSGSSQVKRKDWPERPSPVQPLKIGEGPKPRAQLPLAATESSPKSGSNQGNRKFWPERPSPVTGRKSAEASLCRKSPAVSTSYAPDQPYPRPVFLRSMRDNTPEDEERNRRNEEYRREMEFPALVSTRPQQPNKPTLVLGRAWTNRTTQRELDPNNYEAEFPSLSRF